MATPVALVTRRFCSRCMSVRASSSICTRMGTSRSPALNLARLASMSPMVATRIVSAILLGRDAEARGDIELRHDAQLRPVDRGVGGDVLEAGHLAQRAFELARPRRSALRRCATASRSDSSRSPRSLTYQARVSGISASLSEMIALIAFCGRARSVFGTRLTNSDALRTSRPPVGVLPPSAKTLVTSGMRLERSRPSDRW